MLQNLRPYFTPEQAARILEIEALFSKYVIPNKEGNGWLLAWSSYSIEKTIEQVWEIPEANSNEIFYVAWALLEHTQEQSTTRTEQFISVVIVKVLVDYKYKKKRDYRDEIDSRWLISAVNQGGTSAQAYFAFNLLNDDALIACKDAMLRRLRDTPFFSRIFLHPALHLTPEDLLYGHYRIEPIKVPSGIADGIWYNATSGAVLGTVKPVTIKNNIEWDVVIPFEPFIPAPVNWQDLILEYLGNWYKPT